LQFRSWLADDPDHVSPSSALAARQAPRVPAPPFAIAIAALTVLAVSRTTSETKRSAYAELAQASQRHANAFDGDVRDALAIGRSLATLARAADSISLVNRQVHDFLRRNPHVLGTYVGFEPNAFDGDDAAHKGEPGTDKSGRFLPYWNKLTGKISVEPLLDMETSEYWTGRSRPATTSSPSLTSTRASC
jgi:methyl-accepting chemotaxis protein